MDKKAPQTKTTVAYRPASGGHLSLAAVKWLTRLTWLVAALVLIAVSMFAFPADARHQSAIAAALFDRYATWWFPYPFTIQNAMWIAFFLGLAEFFVRMTGSAQEVQQLRHQLLPEDGDTTMLRQGKDIAPYLERVKESDPDDSFWLQRLLKRTLLSFQATGSIERTHAMLDSLLELFQNEIDRRYSVMRYIIWLIPSIGFLGTVVGILLALQGAGNEFGKVEPGADIAILAKGLMREMTANLGLAFNTTAIALVQSIFLMLAMHFVEAREESALDRVGQYCLDNLINRLYQKP